jgi:hypothetical protein
LPILFDGLSEIFLHHRTLTAEFPLALAAISIDVLKVSCDSSRSNFLGTFSQDAEAMRVFSALILVLAVLFSFAEQSVLAQGGRKPPKSGSTNVPTRPGVSRVATAPDEDAPSKPSATKPSTRFGAASSTESETESDEPTDNRRPTNTGRSGSRFGANSEPASEPPAEEEAAEPTREEQRTASLDNRSTTRPKQRSQQMLNTQDETPSSEEGAEPTPLGSRGTARSIDAQSINVHFNDTPAGLVLSAALNIEHEGAMAGHPIRLEQLVAASPDSNARRQAVKAYWNLAISIADYHHALDEFDTISKIAASSNDKLIEAAAAGAEARVAEAKLTATAAQYDLAAFSPSPTALPIPADAPVIGEYRTEYESLFGRSGAPLGIKRLAAMLPLYRDQVVARGRAVYAASAAQDGAEDLQTFKELSAHRRAFLSAVRDYNDSIADYALQLATPSMSVDTVTSMLIVRHVPAADAAPELSSDNRQVNSEVVPATATTPLDKSPAEKSVVKPRQIGSFRDTTREAEPMEADDESNTETSEPAPDTTGEDATEATAQRRGDLRFGPKANELG